MKLMAMARWSTDSEPRRDPRLHRSGAAVVDVDEGGGGRDRGAAGRGAKAWLEEGGSVAAERYNEADH